jgi:hypothetical protein
MRPMLPRLLPVTSSGFSRLGGAGRITTMSRGADSFEEFEASSLFCPRCRRATRTRKHLLLVLPTGNKYDYHCAECGTAVGGKTDNDASAFRATIPSRIPRPGSRPGGT